MSKKFRAQGILWESLDDGVCAKLTSSISETEKARGAIGVSITQIWRKDARNIEPARAHDNDFAAGAPQACGAVRGISAHRIYGEFRDSSTLEPAKCPTFNTVISAPQLLA